MPCSKSIRRRDGKQANYCVFGALLRWLSIGVNGSTMPARTDGYLSSVRATRLGRVGGAGPGARSSLVDRRRVRRDGDRRRVYTPWPRSSRSRRKRLSNPRVPCCTKTNTCRSFPVPAPRRPAPSISSAAVRRSGRRRSSASPTVRTCSFDALSPVSLQLLYYASFPSLKKR